MGIQNRTLQYIVRRRSRVAQVLVVTDRDRVNVMYCNVNVKFKVTLHESPLQGHLTVLKVSVSDEGNKIGRVRPSVSTLNF